MLYLLSFLAGSVVSGTVLLTAAWRLRNRWSARLTAVRLMAQTARDLENRRVGYDSGRDVLARRDGGRAARVVDGLGTKPGTLAKYLSNKYGD